MGPLSCAEDNKTENLIFRKGLLYRKPISCSSVPKDRTTSKVAKGAIPVSDQK